MEMDNGNSSDEPVFRPNPQDNFAKTNICPGCDQRILPEERYGLVGHVVGTTCGHYAHSDCDVLGVACFCGRGEISVWLGDAPSSATAPQPESAPAPAEVKRRREEEDEDEQAEEEVNEEDETQGPAKWQKANESDDDLMAQDGD